MHPHIAPKRSPTGTLALALGALALAAPAAALGAAGTFTAPGGDSAPGSPKIAGVSCANQRPWTCARGQVLTISGDQLQGTRAVVFTGRAGSGDDVRVAVNARSAAHSDDQLMVVVPRRARSGRVRIVGMVGRPAVSAAPLRVLRSLPAIDDAGHLNKLVAGGRRTARIAYTATGAVPDGAAVEAVRLPQGTVVRTWPLEPAADGTGEVSWDGFDGDAPAATGAYALRLNDAARTVAAAGADSDSQFDLVAGLFPIRGAHRIGRTATQRFGGARGHQGQDVFAACGTPLAAVTKGVVQFTGFHSAAGNYVVVRRPGGESYAYMHMRAPTTVEVGDRVFTGQRLGYVGQTGHAEGCHLHIELWTAPGWYKGGRPYDPVSALERWDAWS